MHTGFRHFPFSIALSQVPHFIMPCSFHQSQACCLARLILQQTCPGRHAALSFALALLTCACGCSTRSRKPGNSSRQSLVWPVTSAQSCYSQTHVCFPPPLLHSPTCAAWHEAPALPELMFWCVPCGLGAARLKDHQVTGSLYLVGGFLRLLKSC